MSAPQPTSYDQIPYGNRPCTSSHPDALATPATLFGMTPAPVDDCRVLELGCARGGNLIPMALSLPASEFTGIDLSSKQIEDAKRVAERLRLRNVRLHAMGVQDVDDAFGVFDYIICHGLYSWVPESVQDKILTICSQNLTPHGVAYVSYNTYPGWHLRGMMREMLHYHVQQFEDPQMQLQQARGFLDFLATSHQQYSPDSLYGQLLKEEREQLDEEDWYVYHEFLEENNRPVYFHEFAERAADKGLQYLWEAGPSALAGSLPAELRTVLERLSTDLIKREQYLDFFRNRHFRRTLLCKSNVRLDRAALVTRLEPLHVVGRAQPFSTDVDLHSSKVERFRVPEAAPTISTNNPVVKTALVVLFELAPRSVPFAKLCELVSARLGSLQSDAPTDSLADELAPALVQCYMNDFVELHTHRPHWAAPGEFPVASPFARLQPFDEVLVTNLRHMSVKLDDFDRAVLRQLDGEHDRAALIDHLEQMAAAGELQLHENDRPVEDPDTIRRLATEWLEGSLRRLADSALLQG